MAGQPPGAGTQLMMPIYISGSYPKELALNSQVPLASAAISDLKQRRHGGAKRTKSTSEPGREAGSKASSGSKPGPSSKPPPAPSPVSLQELVEQHYLRPGTNNVTVTYKGVVYHASLLEDGLIQFEGQTYDVPGGFSLRVKKLQTPSKQSDEGWHAVHVDGVSLEDVRQKWLAAKGRTAGAAGGESSKPASEGGAAADGSAAPAEGAAAGGEGAPAEGAAPAAAAVAAPTAPPAAPASSLYERQLPEGELPVLPSTYDALLPKDAEGGEAEGEAEGEGEPDTSNWVQCSRCQAWRVVPDEFWPDIEAAGDEDWYCEEATWDLTLYDPFTKGCKEYAK